ncbi:hypothetical protein [Marispirochaeta aestuarii]|uniref:hypothetical protein n=1 Tax=Marispirochaeta aestuarii TaxID=1963862 RepID=UPI0029C6DD50|nr:hypothetical protein [Marispirochaeta aestuarii]
MKPKYLIPVALLILSVITSGTFLLFQDSRGEAEPEGRIHAFFHLYASPSREALDSLLREFRAFYPGVDLSYTIEPYQDLRHSLADRLSATPLKKDEVIISILAGRDLDEYSGLYREAIPWISSAWRLYFDPRRLSDLGFSHDDLAALSRRGMEDFSETLLEHSDKTEAIFSLGSAFYLPWLAWIQHLQIAYSGGEIPTGHSPSDWIEGIRAWQALVDAGCFNSDYREANFASSQLAIRRGKGLFVLSDGSIYSTYPPGERIHLDSIPFPGSETENWQVGSSFYIGVFTPQRDEDDAGFEIENLILDYLFSEGLRQRFLAATGVPLLPRSNANSLREIPSLTQKADDPELQELLKYLE